MTHDPKEQAEEKTLFIIPLYPDEEEFLEDEEEETNSDFMGDYGERFD